MSRSSFHPGETFDRALVCEPVGPPQRRESDIVVPKDALSSIRCEHGHATCAVSCGWFSLCDATKHFVQEGRR